MTSTTLRLAGDLEERGGDTTVEVLSIVHEFGKMEGELHGSFLAIRNSRWVVRFPLAQWKLVRFLLFVKLTESLTP